MPFLTFGRLPSQVTVQIIENIGIREILDAYASAVNKSVVKAIPTIRHRVGNLTRDFYRATGTYKALDGGILAGAFGFLRGTGKGKAEAILEQIVKSIKIEFKPFKRSGQKYRGSLEIFVLRSDFLDILDLNEAQVFTLSGERLPWLQWLLLEGGNVIISGYNFRMFPGSGRSGQGIMVQSENRGWRVPPAYSGTIRNNWLTRMMRDNFRAYTDQLTRIVNTEIERAIS